MNHTNHPESQKKPLSATTVALVEVLFALVLVGALALFYRGFLFSRVQGRSMEPTYKNSDFLLCTRSFSPERFDIISFRAQDDMLGERETRTSLRRVIGLPGETVTILEDGTVTVNGVPLEEAYLPSRENTFRPEGQNTITLAEGEYYVLGDNRLEAVDSRDYGPLPAAAILGRALSQPNMLVYILTIVAPLCAALILFWLVDRALHLRDQKNRHSV